MIVQIREVHFRMINFAIPRTDDYALWIRYLSEKGDITERTIVPISLIDRLHLRAICVSSEEFRTFRLARILDVKLRLACDVLVGHEKIRRMILTSAKG